MIANKTNIEVFKDGHIDWDLIGKFRNLEVLSLEDCTGYRVDDEIGNLIKLKQLILAQIIFLTYLQKLENLRILNFFG